VRAATLAALFANIVSACWGSKDYTVGPYASGTDSTGRTAIAAAYEVTQTAHSPINIDGPAVKTDLYGVLVWLCDASVKQTKSLGLLPLSDEAGVVRTPIVSDWQQTAFVIFVRDHSLAFQVSTEGIFTSVPLSASDTLASSQVLTPFCATQMDSLRAIPARKLTWTGR
jgi:hypothetical protein